MYWLASSGFSLLDGVGIAGVVTALVAGFAAIRKLGPEKDALYISSAQGAALIQNNLIATLQAEVERTRARETFLEGELERARSEAEALREENAGLRSRYGTRRRDQKP